MLISQRLLALRKQIEAAELLRMHDDGVDAGLLEELSNVVVQHLMMAEEAAQSLEGHFPATYGQPDILPHLDQPAPRP